MPERSSALRAYAPALVRIQPSRPPHYMTLPICPSWFREAVDEHVRLVLTLNWDKTAEDADYAAGAEQLWEHLYLKSLTGPRDICPVGMKEGRGHALAWLENEVYGSPGTGGLWTCYDCGGKRYTKMDGEFVEWTGP